MDDPGSSYSHDLIRSGLLNPELDLAALAMAFADTGRLQIEDALRPEVADVLYDCLAQDVPWSLAYRDAEGPRKLWAEELAAMSDTDRQALDTTILEIARDRFQFRYNSLMMITAYKEKRDPDLPLHRVVEQINGPAWLKAMRTITGRPHLKRTDAQATRYIAGHFLKVHDDSDASADEGRQVAYVINLSRDWEAHWGGLLQFFDAGGEVTETLMPRFNTISLFEVPSIHCVSPVAEYCPAARYAITGWIRTG